MNLTDSDYDDVEEYKPKAMKWNILKVHMSVARCALAAATVKDRIYLVGGCRGGSKEKLAITECFDAEKKKFTRVLMLSRPCSGLVAASVSVAADSSLRVKVYKIVDLIELHLQFRMT